VTAVATVVACRSVSFKAIGDSREHSGEVDSVQD